jgi:hypothetical protein
VQHGLKHIVSWPESDALAYPRSARYSLSSCPCFQAFPAISTGIYSYPAESATRVALGEVRKFLDTVEAKEVRLVFFCKLAYCSPHDLIVALTLYAVRARYLCSVLSGGRGRLLVSTFVSICSILKSQTQAVKGGSFPSTFRAAPRRLLRQQLPRHLFRTLSPR